MIRVALSREQEALLDDEDARLAAFKWSALKTRSGFYAVRMVDGKYIYLHREVMSAAEGQKVDHKNGNGLDCRRKNLRLATNAQNLHNRGAQRNNQSGLKGVSFDRRRGTWKAEIQKERKRFYLGSFKSAQDAAHAYDQAARTLHGQFAHPNLSEEA